MKYSRTTKHKFEDQEDIGASCDLFNVSAF